MADRRAEEGAASVMVVALTLVLVLVAWGAGSAVTLVVAHRTAQNTADLAALAAAGEAARGGDGCAMASQVAVANGARTRRCVVEGGKVEVDVEVAATWGPKVAIRARARAGPG